MAWEHKVPEGQTDVMPGTTPTSWYTPPDNAQHIAYVGKDNKIHECSFKFAPEGHDWEHTVPSDGHPVTEIGTNSTSWYTPPDNAQHIAYIGNDQQIHECFKFAPESHHWEHTWPSPGHPKARLITSPTSWYTPPDRAQHIAYIEDGLGVINELFFNFAPGEYHWEHTLPLDGHAKAVTWTSPTSWYTPSDNVQHIAYVGGDSQIHEIFFRFTPGGFHWEPSLPSPGHPKVEPGTRPTSWYTKPDNTQHIAYVGQDNKIHELFYQL